MDKKTIISNIIQSIRSHRDYADSKCERDLELAMSDSQFAQLEQERRRLIQSIALNEFHGKDVKHLRKAYDDIIKSLDNLSRKLNLNPYYPEYNCPICQDNGLLDGEYCECVKRMFFKAIKDKSGIDNKLAFSFKEHDIKVFEGLSQRNLIEKLYISLKEYADRYPDVSYLNLILSGGTGTGKTCAISALGNAILDKGYTVNYLTAFDMHNAFMRYHTAPFDKKFIHMDNLLEPDLLILDDLGTEPVFKNVTLEYLYLILSHRVQENKPTLVSTNLLPDEILQRYGERIFSRLLEKRHSRLINMGGEDLRLRR